MKSVSLQQNRKHRISRAKRHQPNTKKEKRSSSILGPGRKAPNFSLNSTPDQKVSLKDFRGQPVILAFYPADWSPVCTDQLSRTDIVSNQVRYNFLQREIEEEVLPYCRKNNITILAYSPLAQGALTGKYSRGHVPKGDIRDENKLFAPKNIEQIEKVNAVLASIARQHGCSASQIALSWLLSNQIVVPIPGAKNEAQAEENVGSTKHLLTNAELTELDTAYELVDIDYLPTVPDVPIELVT